MASTNKTLTPEQTRLIAKALADPRRHEILQRIGAGTDALPCSAMRERVGVSAATLSHHMKELETAGLVAVTRDGKQVSYTVRRDVLRAYVDQLAKI